MFYSFLAVDSNQEAAPIHDGKLDEAPSSNQGLNRKEAAGLKWLIPGSSNRGEDAIYSQKDHKVADMTIQDLLVRNQLNHSVTHFFYFLINLVLASKDRNAAVRVPL